MTKLVRLLFACVISSNFMPATPFAADYEDGATNCWHGQSNIIVRGEGDVALSYVMHGSSIHDDPETPLNKLSFRCVGAGTVTDGTFQGQTFCEAVNEGADKLFTVCVPGKCTFTGGTGALEGITGTAVPKILGPFPAPEPGHFVNCSQNQYKYTIPD